MAYIDGTFTNGKNGRGNGGRFNPALDLERHFFRDDRPQPVPPPIPEPVPAEAELPLQPPKKRITRSRVRADKIRALMVLTGRSSPTCRALLDVIERGSANTVGLAMTGVISAAEGLRWTRVDTQRRALTRRFEALPIETREMLLTLV